MDNGCGANAINDKKKTSDSTERVHFIVSMTNLLHIYTQFLFHFIFWEVIRATQWQCRSLFIFIPTNSICMRLSWLCDTVFLSSAISLSLEAVLCATCDRSVSLFTHCVQREEKKNFMKNVRRDIHGEIMWRIKMGRKNVP